MRWADLLSADAGYLQVPRRPGDLAEILYTSGTTGHPKAVAVRYENASMVPFAEPSWTGGGWMHASPPYTFAGLSFVYTPMKLGLRVVFQPRFDADQWLETVERERPVAVFLVPAMAHLLLEHPRFDTADLGSVTICSVGSAPLAPFVLERLQERMPHALVSNNYRDDRGRVGLLPDAARRSGQAPGFGGQASPARGDHLRRQRRQGRAPG